MKKMGKKGKGLHIEPQARKSTPRSFRLIEDVLIILAIFSLWPTVLGWQGLAFKIIQYVALGILITIFVRRIGRIWGVYRSSKRG